jgi:hypothetical protein
LIPYKLSEQEVSPSLHHYEEDALLFGASEKLGRGALQGWEIFEERIPSICAVEALLPGGACETRERPGYGPEPVLGCRVTQVIPENLAGFVLD